MQIPRWRNILILKNSIIRSTTASTHLATFHTTTPLCGKWKNKWNSHERRDKQPSKYIKRKTRQKRADAKKALDKLLYNIGGDKDPFQDIRRTQKVEGSSDWFPSADDYRDNSSRRKGRPKYCQNRGKSHSKNKRRVRQEGYYDDFGDYTETVFNAMFGKRWYTWSFNYWRGTFGNSHSSFDWRHQTDWHNRRSGKWEAESDVDEEDEPCSVGSPSDRTILGLPATGPLKLEEVKDAFRKSALKWHPDKHQGLSQDMAGEKFKLCVNAYQSLCSALSTG